MSLLAPRSSLPTSLLLFPPRPPRLDTVGAGDTFSAALLAGLADSGRLDARAVGALSAADVEGLLRRAARAAALNCQREGCDPPGRAELEAAMAEPWR
ncbi:unnamed protein product [Prorocentrum cordatum]|uniref:Carbohydrate kinase PfkB domain-containing protein n=1 Tax=Prorocentrum cordatum TaxID=2364126 RepID=A0ABN9VIF5_9DINO|nr:unnamed protein product [Polarella glacialis]